LLKSRSQHEPRKKSRTTMAMQFAFAELCGLLCLLCGLIIFTAKSAKEAQRAAK